MSETGQKESDEDKRKNGQKRVDSLREELQDYADKIEARVGPGEDDIKQSTADNYLQHLRWLEAWLREQDLDVDEVTSRDASKIGTYLGNNYSGDTASKRWKICYKTFRNLKRLGDIDENPFREWDEDINEDFGISTKTSEQDAHLRKDEDKHVTQDEIRLMEENVGAPRLRNQLVIRGLWQTGCRAEEFSLIRHEKDIDWDRQEIRIPPSHAKFDRERYVVFKDSWETLAQKYINDGYRDKFAQSDSEYLFPTNQSPSISIDRINGIVKEAARNAGIQRTLYTDTMGRERMKITPHKIRYGFGYYMANVAEADIYELSKLMGHKNVEVTENKYAGHDPRRGVPSGHEFGPE